MPGNESLAKISVCLRLKGEKRCRKMSFVEFQLTSATEMWDEHFPGISPLWVAAVAGTKPLRTSMKPRVPTKPKKA